MKLLYDGAAQAVGDKIDISKKTLITDGSDNISITFPGFLEDGSRVLVWNGANDNAQYIKSGQYYIKMEITDNFGKVTSMVEDLTIINADLENMLVIYNAAGEAVRHINLPKMLDQQYVNFRLGSSAYSLKPVPGEDRPEQVLKMDVITSDAGATSIQWDGKNNLGSFVQSGTYTVQLISRNGDYQSVVLTRTLVVIKVEEEGSGFSPVAVPNPVGPGQKVLEIRYVPMAGITVDAQLYSITGERAASGADPVESGIVLVNIENLASGVYVAVVESRRGQSMIERKMVKVALIR